MKHKKSYTILASLTGVALTFTLAGCGTTQADDTKTQTLTLSSTPQLKEFPVFSAEAEDLVKGWTTKETTDAETGSTSVLGSVSSDYIEVMNESNSCSFTATIYSDKSYKVAHGDEYNSKNVLYQKNLTVNTVVSDEKTVDVPSSLTNISMVSGKYTNDVYDDLGNVTGKTFNQTGVRVFSVVLPNGYVPENTDAPTVGEPVTDEQGNLLVPEEVEEQPVNEPAATTDEYGNPLNEGLPTVEYTLTCDNEDELTQKTWDELTDSVQLTLKVVAKK